MASLAHIAVDPSQFPQQVRRDLLESLRSRKVNHKFHYDSIKQTQKWLNLHEAYSPARTDPHCTTVYEESFAKAAQEIEAERVQVVGLGCGGGQKDTSLLRLLRKSGKLVSYTPCDVSTAMVLVARQCALEEVPQESCFPLVCDLATVANLKSLMMSTAPGAGRTHSARLFTFFGMLPNFEPEVVLPRLAALLGAGDQLLLSANLAPGDDYLRGVHRVLPLYDNHLSRDWLTTFLLDLGFEKNDGDLRFQVEATSEPILLYRITVHFQFTTKRSIQIDNERFDFLPDENLRLFFSYRHTPGLVRDLLSRYGLQVAEEWITPSGEEGVFLLRPNQR